MTGSKGLWAAVLAVLLVAGCFAPPRKLNDPRVDDPGMIEDAVFASYWNRHDVPFYENRKGLRVAITEFSIEYVTVKYVRALPGGAMKLDPTAPVSALGIGRTLTEYDESFKRELPLVLYDMFVTTLKKEGFDILPKETVTGSQAYQRYVFKGREESSVFQYVNPIGSDTGRIRETETFPVSGLAVIKGAADGAIEDVDAALIEELGVDFVARARFRVGVHEGRASVERGSVVSVTGRDVLGFLESGRSLISEKSVLAERKVRPVRGRRFVVSAAKYRDAMTTLFPKYLELGLRRPDG